MPVKNKTTNPTSKRGRASGKKQPSQKPGYIVRVTNVVTGAQEDVDLRHSAHGNDYTLWPTFTVYIIGFALLGLSFIAHTLRLYSVFAVLLLAAAVLVVGTAIRRSLRRG